MKSFVNILFVLSIIFIFIFSGCELFTNTPDQNGGDTFGDDLIISEIFTIPPHQYYAYSWIEVYNPSRKSFYWFEQSFPSIAVIVGEEGTILYTEDNGYTWQVVSSPTTETLRATSFSLTDTGLAVGDNGTIIRLTRLADGKLIASDYSYTNPDPAMKNLNDIYLLTAPGRAGYMVGDSGGIFRTTNRGNTWDLYTNQRLPYNLHSINYQNFDRIWTVGDSGVIMRSHSAKIWTPKAPPEEFPTANFYACT
ncbi:MAG: hypothetical protein HY800_01495, partial [Ignavibacteriales bacterium]|nr:hypothetical protein [Ignavibacteriales bacterium]